MLGCDKDFFPGRGEFDLNQFSTDSENFCPFEDTLTPL